jgi:hypothetical protein
MISKFNKYALVLWPKLRAYGIEKFDICNKVIGNSNFSIYVDFMVSKTERYVDEKIMIFSKLPDIFSISIDPYEFEHNGEKFKSHLFYIDYTIYDTNGNPTVKFEAKDINFEFDKMYNLLVKYNHKNKILEYYLNNELMISLKIENELYNKNDNSQIVLGTYNYTHFPSYKIDYNFLIMAEDSLSDGIYDDIKSNYLNNLNEYDEYLLTKKYGLLGFYDFKKHTAFKIFDFTGNNNHIYIQEIENE